MRLPHGVRNMHFTKALCLHKSQPMHLNSFSQNVRLAHVLVNICFRKRPFYVCYLTYVKHALMNVH